MNWERVKNICEESHHTLADILSIHCSDDALNKALRDMYPPMICAKHILHIYCGIYAASMKGGRRDMAFQMVGNCWVTKEVE